jgi:hypothetical protein
VHARAELDEPAIIELAGKAFCEGRRDQGAGIGAEEKLRKANRSVLI